MRSANLAYIACLTALLAACAAVPNEVDTARVEEPAPQAPPQPMPAPPPPTPQATGGGAITVTASRVARSTYNSPTPITVISSERMSSDLSRSPEGQRASNKIQYRYAAPPNRPPIDRERYAGEEVSPVKLVAQEPVSTFSVDVDTGAYANVRRFLSHGSLPPRAAVRTEELINYFRYDYPAPKDRSTPFTVTTNVALTPWNPDTRLLRIGLRGYDLPRASRPPANLVFLIDVSGSMNARDKLPLVKAAMHKLAGELQDRDRVSIVVYAGAAGLVLPATNEQHKIRAALERLQAGGSTAGGAGLKLAYSIARENMIEGGVNRIILATDGDFNVGTNDTDTLIEMIEKQRDLGITLTTLGFGSGNYNEAMMEQIADHGNGNYAYIDTVLEAQKVLSDEMTSTLFTIAKDVKIQVEFNPSQVSQYRLIGYENRILREEDFDNDRVDAGDIGAGHQVTAIYEFVPTGVKGWIGDRRYSETGESTAKGRRSNELAFVRLRYKLPNGSSSRLIKRVIPTRALTQAQLPRGDMAFATAVAAYGQKLRGDSLLRGYDFPAIIALAGDQKNFWRQEFIRLADAADGLDGD